MPFTKGHKLSTGRPKGSKNVETLAKEERRAIFEEEVSQIWRDKIKELRPEYIADQFMGKAPDLLDITTKGESLNDARLDEIIATVEDGLDNIEGTA